MSRRPHPLKKMHRLVLLPALLPAAGCGGVAGPTGQLGRPSHRGPGVEVAQGQGTGLALPLYVAGDSGYSDRFGSCNGNLHLDGGHDLRATRDFGLPLHPSLLALNASTRLRLPLPLLRKPSALPGSRDTEVLHQQVLLLDAGLRSGVHRGLCDLAGSDPVEAAEDQVHRGVSQVGQTVLLGQLLCFRSVHSALRDHHGGLFRQHSVHQVRNGSEEGALARG